MKKIALFLLFAAHFALASVSNHFEAYAEPFPIHHAALFDGKLFLATDGGIRSVDQSGRSLVYTSSHGLGATSFASLVASGNALYGISAKGIICRLSKGGKATEINRSFENVGSVAENGLAVFAKKYIVIAFNDKLAIFDTEKESYLVSLSKLGTVSLDATSPTALLISNDSLFVALNGSVYYRQMDWDNLDKDRRLVDPTSWNLLKNGTQVRSMAIVNGQLQTRMSAGSFFLKNGRLFSAAEDTSKIVLNGEKVFLEKLYSKGLSRVKYVFEFDGRYFLVGTRFVGYGDAASVSEFTKYGKYELGGTYEVTALPNGGVVAAGLNGKISFYSNGSFSKPQASYGHGSNKDDGPGHLMKTLAVLPSGEMLYALWGIGLFIYKNADFSKNVIPILATDGTCIDNYLENFMTPISATAAPDGTGFLVSYRANKSYGIAYINLSGDVFCASNVGTSEVSGTIVARPMHGNLFETFVAVNTGHFLVNNGYVDRFVLRSPQIGGSLQVEEKVQLKTPEHGYPIDLAFAPDSALWVATYFKVGYWKSGDSILAPARVSQFSGTAYSSIAVDPQGNVWVGSTLDGLYHLSRKKNSNDTLSAVHYRTRDGLLCDNVYDLALDSVSGTLWMAQNIGMTSLTRNDLRSANGFMTDSAESKVKVYPNPFRPKMHSKVVFDFVAENARVSIYNAGGRLVASFANEDLVGGRVEWDGRDGSGNLVAPGVYTYVILQKGKSEKQGRLIIAH